MSSPHASRAGGPWLVRNGGAPNGGLRLGMGAFATSIATSSADPVLAGWDDLVIGHDVHLPAHHLYTSTPWLRRYEVFGQWDPRYIVASDAGTLLGGLPTHSVDPARATLKVRVDDLFAGLEARPEVPASMAPCRVAGGLIDGRTGALTRPGRPLAERGALIDGLFAEAERIATELGERAVICRCIDAADLLLRSVLRGRGYVEQPGPTHLVLTRPPGGLEGYIASFPNRYRNMIRREMRKLRDAGVVMTYETLTRDLIAAVLPLAAQLHEKHAVDARPDATRNDYEILRRIFKQDAQAVVARVADRPVGFVELVVYRGNAWAHQAGFDYEFQGALPLYFGVLFYGLMDAAEAARLSRIDYSFGTENAKIARGCRSRPTVRAIRVLDPSLVLTRR